MKKSDLIKFLNDVEGDPEILLSSDDEGNSFRRFTGTSGLGHTSVGRVVLVLYPSWDEVELE